MAQEYTLVRTVQDLGVPTDSYAVRLPDQLLTEAEKFAENGQWFANNLRYVCSFYNRQLRNVGAPEQFEDNPGQTNDSLNTPVMNMLKYILFHIV